MIEKTDEIIYWARKLNERGFVTARSGNISLKVENGILITAQDSYLGELRPEEVLLVDADGNLLEGAKPITTEKELHLGVHRRFPETRAVIHAHSPYTTAFFNHFDELDIFSFEAAFYLGDVKVVPQQTPTVTDLEPVLRELSNTNIVVLGRHGVVSMGEDFKAAFSLVELLEEQARVNLLLKASGGAVPRPTGRRAGDGPPPAPPSEEGGTAGPGRKYVLLSEEHVRRLVELVNNDEEAQELGKKYGLTCTLAVKDVETGSCARFHYDDGRITGTDSDEDAEFLISGRSEILKKVFNREVDPFVAATQGKVKTKGDLSKMSRWYPVLVRTFRLWERAPVE